MDTKTLKALANEHRIQILRALEEGPKTYSDLLVLLGWDLERDRGKFTYHLTLLRESGLLEHGDGPYRLSGSGEAALLAFEASELPPETRTRFSDYYRALGVGHRLIVVLLFLGVGLYLFGAGLGLRSGLQGNDPALLLGLVLLLLGVASLFLILYALPGGRRFRWERAVLFALAAGIYGSFLGLVGQPPQIALGLVPAAALAFLGYRSLSRERPRPV
jgi:DNA-binding transcriptional ArsR family regulator